MTDLLQRALCELQKRPSADQDAIAALILDELEDDRRWDESFAGSQDKLAALARQARLAVEAGQARQAGWDEL
jgi:hypothetical protein